MNIKHVRYALLSAVLVASGWTIYSKTRPDTTSLPEKQAQAAQPTSASSPSEPSNSRTARPARDGRGEDSKAELENLGASKSFQDYAQTTRFFERMHALGESLGLSISALVQGLNLSGAEKGELEAALKEQLKAFGLEKRLVEAVEKELSPKELEKLTGLYQKESMSRTIEREHELLKGGGPVLAQFMKSIPAGGLDPLLKVTQQRVEEVGLWKEAQDIHTEMMNSLSESLNLSDNGISKDQFTQLSNVLLDAQKESFQYNVMYLFQDLDPGRWTEYAAIQKDDLVMREKESVHQVFGEYMNTLAQTTGAYIANIAPRN
jgi:hypothetical protein